MTSKHIALTALALLALPAPALADIAPFPENEACFSRFGIRQSSLTTNSIFKSAPFAALYYRITC